MDLVRWVKDQEWSKGTKLCVLGNSVGTGPALWLAGEEGLGVERCVLVSPYTSLWAVGIYWGVSIALGWVGLKRKVEGMVDCLAPPDRLRALQKEDWDPFPARENAARLGNCEVLVVHGEGDTVIPVTHGESVAGWIREAGGQCRFVGVRGCEHRDTRVGGEEVIRAFLGEGLGEGVEREIEILVEGGGRGNEVGPD